MSAIEEIQAELERFRSERADLDAKIERYEQALALLADEKASAPARPPERKPRVSRKTSPRKAKAPAAKAKAAASKRGEATRKALLAHIRKHPGCSGRDAADGIGVAPATISRLIPQLRFEGTIRVEDDERPGRTLALFPAEAALAPADENGGKTGLERDIIDAIGAGSSSALSIAEVCHRPLGEVKSVLGALVTRRVLIRNGSGANAFYERVSHPKTMRDRERNGTPA